MIALREKRETVVVKLNASLHCPEKILTVPGDARVTASPEIEFTVFENLNPLYLRHLFYKLLQGISF